MSLAILPKPDSLSLIYRVGIEDVAIEPCHISDLKKDDVFYWVIDGELSDLRQALSNPICVRQFPVPEWTIEDKHYA